MTERNPMDDTEYRGYGLAEAAYLREQCDDLKALVRELRGVLEAHLKSYVDLIESGDCGRWDAEKEPEVIAARKALAKSAELEDKT